MGFETVQKSKHGAMSCASFTTQHLRLPRAIANESGFDTGLIEFLIDKEKRLVAVKPCKDHTVGYSIFTGASLISVYAFSVIKALNIPKGRYPVHEQDGMLVIDINNPL
jgi:hypothetical protein